MAYLGKTPEKEVQQQSAPISSLGADIISSSTKAEVRTLLEVVSATELATEISNFNDDITDIGSTLNSIKNGRLLNVLKFTTSASYTPDANMNFIIAEIQGGGGGGGGTSPSAGNTAVGGGGGAGAYLKVLMTRAQLVTLGLTTSINITVGSRGNGGAVGTSGGNGGSSIIGSAGGSPLAGGGIGGFATVAFGANGVAGGGSGGANFITFGTELHRSIGESGRSGFWANSSIMVSGAGGNSIFGAGGAPTSIFSSNANASGTSATGKGCGGSGGVASNGGSATGGNGEFGLVRIWEYS